MIGNTAAGLPWVCMDLECSGGAISVYDTSNLRAQAGSVFDSNRWVIVGVCARKARAFSKKLFATFLENVSYGCGKLILHIVQGDEFRRCSICWRSVHCTR